VVILEPWTHQTSTEEPWTHAQRYKRTRNLDMGKKGAIDSDPMAQRSPRLGHIDTEEPRTQIRKAKKSHGTKKTGTMKPGTVPQRSHGHG
jgi:hypothetical protein